MKSSCIKICLTAASLLLAVNLACAVEVKVATPDVGGAAKATSDKTKATAADAKAGAKGAATDAKAKAKVVDINTASDAELKAVSGIGDAYAAKIIAGRPYANKAQLKSRNIMPSLVYEKVKDQIIAKQPKK